MTKMKTKWRPVIRLTAWSSGPEAEPSFGRSHVPNFNCTQHHIENVFVSMVVKIIKFDLLAGHHSEHSSTMFFSITQDHVWPKQMMWFQLQPLFKYTANTKDTSFNSLFCVRKLYSHEEISSLIAVEIVAVVMDPVGCSLHAIERSVLKSLVSICLVTSLTEKKCVFHHFKSKKLFRQTYEIYSIPTGNCRYYKNSMRASFGNNSQKKKNYFFVRKDLFLWELLWRFLNFSYNTENPIGTTRWQQWLTWIYHIVPT